MRPAKPPDGVPADLPRGDLPVQNSALTPKVKVRPLVV